MRNRHQRGAAIGQDLSRRLVSYVTLLHERDDFFCIRCVLLQAALTTLDAALSLCDTDERAEVLKHIADREEGNKDANRYH